MGGTPSLFTVPLTTDRVVLVTGGNTGIGYETSKWIAMMGARVIIACRSEERAKNAIENMQKEFEEEKAKGTAGICSKERLDVEFRALDLASLNSVENFIETFKSKETKLHLLLCNAGIAMHPLEYTEDGFEIMFQIMQMYCLNRRLQKTNVTVNSIHPGIVDTEINRSFSDLGMWKVFFQISKLIGMTKTPFEGAKPLINIAVNPYYKDTRDAYYIDMRIQQANSLARNQEKQEALWKYSLDCLQKYLKPEDVDKIEKL